MVGTVVVDSTLVELTLKNSQLCRWMRFGETNVEVEVGDAVVLQTRKGHDQRSHALFARLQKLT